MDSIEEMDILGVIPARGGSKGIPRKNLLSIGGKNLIERAIASSEESELLTHTVVSTEDEEMLEVAKEAGGNAPFRRPERLATDTASSMAVVQHAAEMVAENQGWDADIVVLLQPTTPFRRGYHIDETLRTLHDSGVSSAMTVRPVDYPPHWMLTQKEDGTVQRLIKDADTYKRRQDTPEVLQPSGAVYAMRRSLLRPDLQLPVSDTKGIRMSVEESVNIDELWEYHLACTIWEEEFRGE